MNKKDEKQIEKLSKEVGNLIIKTHEELKQIIENTFPNDIEAQDHFLIIYLQYLIKLHTDTTEKEMLKQIGDENKWNQNNLLEP